MRFSAARSGFTLIELIVVITIMAILAIGIYVPYQRYEHISRVRVSAERADQTVTEARTLALNGYMMPGTDTNANVGVLFERGAKSVKILAYPHDTATGTISIASAAMVREIGLSSSVSVVDLPSGLDTLLLYFTAPRAQATAFDLDGAVPRALPSASASVVVGFSGATTAVDDPGSLLRSVRIHF
jgi:prepilin-type N-terminal cleavage/methylation domain-containing protein